VQVIAWKDLIVYEITYLYVEPELKLYALTHFYSTFTNVFIFLTILTFFLNFNFNLVYIILCSSRPLRRQHCYHCVIVSL